MKYYKNEADRKFLIKHFEIIFFNCFKDYYFTNYFVMLTTIKNKKMFMFLVCLIKNFIY